MQDTFNKLFFCLHSSSSCLFKYLLFLCCFRRDGKQNRKAKTKNKTLNMNILKSTFFHFPIFLFLIKKFAGFDKKGSCKGVREREKMENFNTYQLVRFSLLYAQTNFGCRLMRKYFHKTGNSIKILGKFFFHSGLFFLFFKGS